MEHDDESRVWVESPSWRVLPEGHGKRCRRRGCHKSAVAELFRPGISRPLWWAYCPDHMYGRQIRDGKVMWLIHRNSPGRRESSEADLLRELGEARRENERMKAIVRRAAKRRCEYGYWAAGESCLKEVKNPCIGCLSRAALEPAKEATDER